ncbi:Glutamyl-tRNA(Gln) amidotransferase subunit A [Gracilariopsis chorda]|uniref:Glutamyl-tRNA(Gln) amidotransferase subunit A, mitochondrial n=1 Tax=Gracilariopsis chorda TaxID=448386 RepID=A0A2V3ISM8_9FLOR|nr:Glutamyl-tRNA(Gln) amidotransferase subunit A [Gracilariopsis chorda]|eukprot:PXF45123.1 Glutamyl-tRNA(Gln) amidotransferase subunit A [Gracilariopsis chorda]
MSMPITCFVTSTNSISRFLSRPSLISRQKLRCCRSLRTTPRSSASRPINEIVQSIRSRETSASRLLDGALSRIEEIDPHVNAYLSVDVEDAQSQARRIDEQIARGKDPGPLAGIPISIKDNISTKGQPTTAASRILDGFTPAYNATAVQRLIDSGAVILGKTNLDEFGMGGSTEYSAFTETRNPWDLSRVPGGSSGGSAAAVATGMCMAALGTDTGGSIRQPASFCGITGFKPSYGRISRHGLLAYASSLDTIGPLCRSAEDAALLMQVMAGADGMDSTASKSPVPTFSAYLEGDLSGLRFGVVEESLASEVDTEVSNAVQNATDVLKSLGADVQTVSLPFLSHVTAAYYVIAYSEASANLARYDGVRYGTRAVDAQNSSDMYAQSRAAGFGGEVKRRLMAGTYALSSGYYDAYYLKAQRVRAALTNDIKKAFAAGFDALITPVAATPAFKLGEKLHDPVLMMLGDTFTIPANLSGLPAVSLPCGKTESNLPIGFQVIGEYMKDEVVLKIGHAYQQATLYHEMVPRAVEASVALSV